MSKDKDILVGQDMKSPLPEDILQEARKLIYGDRNKDYGHPKESTEKTAALWTAYLGHTITPDDVCMLMILLKIVRQKNRYKRDNLIDIAGYAGVADRINEYFINPFND